MDIMIKNQELLKDFYNTNIYSTVKILGGSTTKGMHSKIFYVETWTRVADNKR